MKKQSTTGVLSDETKTSIGGYARLAVRPSYRQKFGLDNPPKNSLVKIEFLEGLKYFVVWLDCPDLENVVEMNFTTKNKALEYAASCGWCVQADR